MTAILVDPFYNKSVQNIRAGFGGNYAKNPLWFTNHPHNTARLTNIGIIDT